MIHRFVRRASSSCTHGNLIQCIFFDSLNLLCRFDDITTGRASRTRRVGRSQGRRQCPSPTWWDPGDLHAYDASIKAWVKAPFPLDMTGPGGSARTRYAEYRPGSAAIPTPRYRHLGGPHAQSAPTKAQLPRPVPPERGAHGGRTCVASERQVGQGPEPAPPRPPSDAAPGSAARHNSDPMHAVPPETKTKVSHPIDDARPVPAVVPWR